MEDYNNLRIRLFWFEGARLRQGHLLFPLRRLILVGQDCEVDGAGGIS